ncbi:hypothetical protein CYR55_17025 [Chimaeribacter californicus]|uniref:Uncharacterized protein n=2 Tax=Chimaeribacter californicus TaxID=2060067 RepID=A0A2N5DZK2_9GAMM|nr:hypothetical protein CYR55_17025 [Chimaeribacter californicus]
MEAISLKYSLMQENPLKKTAMGELSIQEIHHHCIATTQKIIQGFGWHDISLSVLSTADKERLKCGEYTGELNWQWAMNHYSGDANDGIINISLKVMDYADSSALHAVILCKYDVRRAEFSLCMLENFIASEQISLTGNVLIIALIYSTTFCDILEIDDVIIQDPTKEAKPRYRSYGFADVWSDFNKMSSTVSDIKQCIVEKIASIV